MGWKPIRKVAAGIVTAVLVPAILAGLAVLDVAQVNWAVVAAAAGGTFITALTAYLTPFAGNEQYRRFTSIG
jgi:hypothetical protein